MIRMCRDFGMVNYPPKTGAYGCGNSKVGFEEPFAVGDIEEPNKQHSPLPGIQVFIKLTVGHLLSCDHLSMSTDAEKNDERKKNKKTNVKKKKKVEKFRHYTSGNPTFLTNQKIFRN